MNKNSFYSFIIIIILVVFGCCSLGLSKNEYIQIFFQNGKKIIAEVAITDVERQRGLMYREKINEDQGMLFVFEEEGIYSFWMKNMNIPLDILWLNKEKRIIHIEINVPPCYQEPCQSYESVIPALYVLELKAGFVENNGIKIYDRIDFVYPQ